ncbi:alpha-hydroxy-acid oxidizing enzyme [Microvirgula aerodenitrificans]|uniref:Alpha-hydroxy-acid oxidizing enzyme n=1 Tax=Microvirgula aerodenitrificans TaxID=57480 RepID=A0A2S0P8W8_9NEIS|nr:alpha-hydroxy acid oxidase [Microvirgula aerodenitrificans]AVY93753.1 alpha-hydroxy-acid oxidizing enzyme [Microvirgula aerodenitrificans]
MPPAPRPGSIPRDIAAVADYEPFARRCLDDNAWAYLAGGAADEHTLRWNRAAFDAIRLQGSVLADVSGGHTRLTLFGHDYAHPVFLAPVAHQRLFHPDGELATAQAAEAMDAAMLVSTLASTRLEDIARVGRAPLWFQLYVQPDRGFTRTLVERAEAAGYRALVVTVDAPVWGLRNREQRAGFQLPPGVEPVNLRGMSMPGTPQLAPGQSMVFDGLMAHAPTWRDIEALRGLTRLPLILKGICSARDAQQAARLGIDGVIVSNHGGRTLDTLPASIDALPVIADAVGPSLPLLLDGGIRRGSDIVKALALGARAVLIGRPYLHGLATAGALGAAHVIKLLREELEVTMALCGCARLQDIDRRILFTPLPGRTSEPEKR